MVVNGRPLKRMKRRVTAELNDFLAFPPAGDSPVGPFRITVREFLSKHATLPPPSSLFPHLLTWQILFRVGDLTDGPDALPAVVCLDVVEEDVARSRSVYCDQCRVVGWSGNPVCAKRYHFIIKADGCSIGGYQKSCAGCGDVLHLSESRCKSCNHVLTTEDVEDWMYHQLEDTTHLLHGVVHSNGYAHLLRVNGREGGSRVLSGCHIMDFWDRLCKILAVRKASVMDVSRKYSLEYRLLHAITKGHTWYGDWGYEFGAGSFGLSHDAYKMAVETISNQPLSIFLSQGRKPRTRLQDLISFYQSLSERELVNIRDLFCFLMNLLHDGHKHPSEVDETSCKKQRFGASGVLCSWTATDIERVEEAMFRVLRAVTGPNWVSWRALRGAVCKAASPELLDYCLKELNGKQTADGMVVHAQSNPESGAFEYRLEPSGSPLEENSSCTSSLTVTCPSAEHLLRDLKFLYESMLHPETMLSYGPKMNRDIAIVSARKLLDCKQFVKNYYPEKTIFLANPCAVYLSCEVELQEQSEECFASPPPPPELLILPPNATILDLKHEASKAFQEVYLVCRRFQAEELVGCEGVDESTQVKLLLGSADSVRVRGRIAGKSGLTRFRMERGLERWTVDCSCGAKDDDGERMLACDVCGVWQHTRCAGIPDCDSVPLRFICQRCEEFSGRVSKFSKHCQDSASGESDGVVASLGRSLTDAV